MLPQEIILKKRGGGVLTPDEIRFFVDGLTSGAVTEGQVAALAMAVFFKGLEMDERVALTLAMRDSGEVLRWDLPGPVADKHSTGGVGDNVSLMLAPALAACGVYVPMISGRGLGHTGGTLDKLASIPGYDVAPGPEALERVVREVGCAVIGQTAEIAPADKRFYAIRDVTGTVESLDLITASILSKKLAAGLDALVLDVKAGSGAFMGTVAEAEALAASLVGVANGAGCRTSALVTGMDEPLASACGNALEVANAVRFLTGTEVDARLWDVTVALGGELLFLTGLAKDAEAGRARLSLAFEDGSAAERFGRMVTALGGPADFVERFDAYREAFMKLTATQEVRTIMAGGCKRIVQNTRKTRTFESDIINQHQKLVKSVHGGVCLFGFLHAHALVRKHLCERIQIFEKKGFLNAPFLVGFPNSLLQVLEGRV